MATSEEFGRWWERPRQRGYLQLLENLRSKLTWMDALVGFCAAIILSIILIGFRYQIIPDYTVGMIADRDIRAVRDVVYENRTTTKLDRAAAEAGVPALYQFKSDLIAERLKSIASAFADARNILDARKAIPSKKPFVEDRALLLNLEDRVGRTFPSPVLSMLLHQRFNPILDAVLRDGIISNRVQFLKDQRSGITIRDSASGVERLLEDAYLARDLSAAFEFLRQSSNTLSELSQRERGILAQYLETAIFPTLVYDPQETTSRRVLAALRVKPDEMQIKRGQTIVRSGEPITPDILLQLEALRNLLRPRSLIWQLGGYFLLAAILVYSLWRYFVFYQTRHRKIRNHTVLILAVIATELLTIRLATSLADIFSERFQRFHDPFVLYYGIPFAFGALLITLLIDVNLGVMGSVFLAILSGLFYGDVDLAVYLIIGSLAGIYSIRAYRDRAAILKAGLTIGIVNIFCLAGLDMIRQTPMTLSDGLDQLILALLSGVLASTLASMLLPALESFFKITTDIRLLELSNLNAPILRRLSVEAPGTYHHSLMVATLAETAAESIGANPLLVRVAAYYHDLGKLLNSDYFVENQSYGDNKHAELAPDQSCRIIGRHVPEGLKLAKENGLPQRITDMIPQHHGTRVMEFFYRKAKNTSAVQGNKVIDADFRYPGPKPQSKEAAIMMMADTVEAASRTLADNPNADQIKGMIDRLIESIIQDHQFEECDITLRDVRIVRESFYKILTGIFHNRIEYPGYDFGRMGGKSQGSVIQNPD
jgi:putative nucleotidyltransferase with HDIG domain